MSEKTLNYFCILGGGAIRGLTYVGALRALKEKNVNITGYAGASAGSIAAVMEALDYNCEEMEDIFVNFDYMLFRDLNFSFKIELALSKGEVFTDKIREIINKKLGSEKPVTFRDFPKDLYILTSNLSTGESVVFSKKTTPDFEVAQAVRISAAFPGLMNPYEYEDNIYVDGDLGKSCALFQLSPLLNPDNQRILEFRLEGSKVQEKPKNPLEFLNNAVDFVTNVATENVVKTFSNKDKYDLIVLEAEDTLLFDFNISKDKKESLIRYGYETTKNYFEKSLPEKRKALRNEYEKMCNAVLPAYKKLINRKYENAKNILNQFVCENYEKFDELDVNIVSQFNSIAKKLNNGYSKKIFFIPIFDNHDGIKESFSSLIFEIENKIKDLKS